MSVKPFNRIYRSIQRYKKDRGPKAAILMYHHVADFKLDPWGLAVSPQHFAEQLEIIRQLGQPLSLAELVEAHRLGTVPDRAVVITFDDGYKNNLYNAKPILEDYNIPATVFITSDYVGQNREFWWDELERVMLQPGRLPDTLQLEFNNQVMTWPLEEATHYTSDQAQTDLTQRTWDKGGSPRFRFYYRLWKSLQPLPDADRRQVLDNLVRWAGASAEARASHCIMSSSEVRTLAEDGLVEIGAHTATHPSLSAHPVEFQRQEIQRGKEALEQFLATPIVSFAYPHGNYTAETPGLVQELGFECACTTAERYVQSNSDRFQFPRFFVQDWNGAAFKQELINWYQL